MTDEAPRPSTAGEPPDSRFGEAGSAMGAAGRPIGEAGRSIGSADLWRAERSGTPESEPAPDAPESEPVSEAPESGPASGSRASESASEIGQAAEDTTSPPSYWAERPEEPKDTSGWRPADESGPSPAPALAPVPQPMGAALPQWGRPATAVAPPPREAWLTPLRVQAIPGTNFAVVHLGVPPATSGLAIGSLVAGIASVVVSFVVWCFGLVGASSGWGAWVAGAFAMIAGLAGVAAVVLALLGLRQIRRASGVRIAGRGVAVAGLVCGAVGLGLTLLGFGLSLLIQVSIQ